MTIADFQNFRKKPDYFLWRNLEEIVIKDRKNIFRVERYLSGHT
jgi:hypothetical protein